MADSIQHGIMAYCDEKRNKLEEALQDTQAQIREEVEKIDQELEQEKGLLHEGKFIFVQQSIFSYRGRSAKQR